MSSATVKAVRAEVERLAVRGSSWLVEVARSKGMGKRVTISASIEYALLEELRARAALALLEGRDPDIPPASLDGKTCKGVVLTVDPEQFADFWPTGKPKPTADAPRGETW